MGVHHHPTANDDDGNKSSSTSSDDRTTPSVVRREAWTARGQLLLNFHHVISLALNSPEMRRKCTLIGEDMTNASSSSSSSSSSLSEQYGAEAAMIIENKSRRDAFVRDRTIALGISSFVALRGCRGIASMISRGRRAMASYRLDSLPTITTTTTRAASSTSSSSPAAATPHNGKLRKFFGVGIDVTISTSIALLSGTYLFMPRPSAYMEDMSKLPLVEGKSVYAEMVCPPLLREYRRVLETYGGRWPVRSAASATASSSSYDCHESAGENGNVPDIMTRDASYSRQQQPLTQEDVSLNVIRNFVENCYRRSRYERALLEDRNALSSFDDYDENDQEGESALTRLIRRLSGRRRRGVDGDTSDGERPPKLGTVSIPSPGVPRNVPVNLDVEILSLVSDDGREGGGYGR
jgi:hypothetical protein